MSRHPAHVMHLPYLGVWAVQCDHCGPVGSYRDPLRAGEAATEHEAEEHECPAGGRHVPTNAGDYERTVGSWRCDECGASLPAHEERSER